MSLPLNIDWQQILLHLFNFIILAGGLYLLLYKPVRDFMDKRREHYAALEKEANDSLENAKKSEEEYALRLKNAETEIAKMKSDAEKAANESAEEIISRANSEREEIIEKAAKEGEREKAAILDGAKDEIAALAVNAAEKILKQTEGKNE